MEQIDKLIERDEFIHEEENEVEEDDYSGATEDVER